MNISPRRATTILPFLYLPVFVASILSDRATLNDPNFAQLIQRSAPEDIIGGGFWFTWVVLAIPFLLLCLVNYAVGRQQSWHYWMILLSTFLGLTAVGFAYGHALEMHVFAI